MSNLTQSAPVQPADIRNQPDPGLTDHRDLSQHEQPARPRRQSGWLSGLALITIGSVFMLQNAGILQPLTNWWAMFLLFPAVGAFSAAVAVYQRRGSWAAASVPFIVGLMILSLAIAFLLEINLSLVWPFFLIVSGIAIVGISALARSRARLARDTANSE